MALETERDVYGEGGPITETADLPALLQMFGPNLLKPETTPDEILAEMRSSPQLRKFAAQLVRQAQENIAQSDREQQIMAKTGPSLDRKHVEGLGELKATIHERKMNELCTEYGPNWFRDKEMLRDTLKRHPEFKAKSTSRSTTVSMSPSEPAAVAGYVVNDRRAAASYLSADRTGAQGEPAIAVCPVPSLSGAASVHATPAEETPSQTT